VLKWGFLPKSIGRFFGDIVLLNRSFRWIAATWLLSLSWNVFIAAQEVSKPSVPKTPMPVETVTQATVDSNVEEVRPSVFYLPDKQGNLQAVLDFPYEDFVELYKLKQRLEQQEQRPRYSIQDMTISGSAGTDSAELTIHFQILLGESNWVRVPLRLDQGLLREPAEYQGPGEHFLHFEGNGEGYVAWIRSKKEGLHEITLKMLIPLSQVGEQSKLKLNTPRATSSELKMKVAESKAVATVSEGALLLSPAAAEEGGTVFKVLGLGGEFELAWHKEGSQVAEIPAVLEATGNILTRLDNREITSEAALSVHSYGAAFDRFTVRLPPGAELIPGTAQGYTAVPLEAKHEQATGKSLVEVRLQKKTVGPVEVRLSARRNIGQEQSPEGSDLAGFEVVGAARQWGTIAVAAANNWQVVFGAHQGVRRVDVFPDSLRNPDIVAGFEYSAFPYTLIVRLAPRKTRINVEPEYVLLVERDHVQLEAKLTYFIRGAKVNVLYLAMPDWELDEVGPENLVAVDGIDRKENGLAAIPLQQPSSGQVELRLRAHKFLAKPVHSFSASLPLPQVLSSGPAVVAVVPADNVELTPDAKAIQGLIRQQIAPPMKLPERQQEPLFYRSEGKTAVFAAEMRVHSLRVTAEAVNYVHLEEESARVEQKFALSIAYEAIDHVLLDVPGVLAQGKSMEIQHGGKPLLAKILPESETASVPAGIMRMRVNLPEASIGSCDLTVRYTTPLPPLTSSSPRTCSVPLVMPADCELTGNNLYLTAAPKIKIVGHDAAWKSTEKGFGRNGLQTRLQLQTLQRQNSLNLNMQREELGGSNTAVVERAWIQTWLTSSARQDRAIYQFTTNQKELVFQLPKETAADQVLVMLDGQRVAAESLGENRFSLELVGDAEIHRYLLELRYNFSGRRPPRGLLSLDFPRLGDNLWIRRMYWQLVLPQNEHVIANPAGFVGEYRWNWSGYYWGREPLLDQAQLENWIGTAQHAVLPEGVNTYLYGILGNVDHAEVCTANRSLFVLTASGAALILGLLLIYVPLVRHPLSLLVMTLVLLSLTMIYPESTALFAQASGLGLALTLMAGFLERSMARRRKTLLLPESSQVIRDLTSTRSPHLMIPAVSADSSTKAAAPAVQSPPLPEEPS
jgi:hypothetical protein